MTKRGHLTALPPPAVVVLELELELVLAQMSGRSGPNDRR